MYFCFCLHQMLLEMGLLH